MNKASARQYLQQFDFKKLFLNELGWDHHSQTLSLPIDTDTVTLTAIAEKRGMTAFLCHMPAGKRAYDYPTRCKIETQLAKRAHEHLIIYAAPDQRTQIWQWVKREPGKPIARREHTYTANQPGDSLLQKLEKLVVTIEEEEILTLTAVTSRVRQAFDLDRVTKRFYDRFKTEHAAFLKLVKGIPDAADRAWYTSLMLNRLMFVYFIQKKGFLDGDADYLRNRLTLVRKAKGKDKFLTFYRYFLLRLFHDGLGKAEGDRKLDPTLEKLLGKVPYLNGGFFEVHQIEEQNPDIDIPDQAFEKLFDFFDQYSWHLDERPLRADNEINPDVVGYIFEKYINQKQMGAYYTKEDITEYISKNTIIPHLFDTAEKKCAVAFQPGSALWQLLRDNPDRYIYPPIRKGVIDDEGNITPLPTHIAAGIKNIAKRDSWNQPADPEIALPTETWREHVARRQRCLDVREQLSQGKIHSINDLITLNLDIWQFARDAISSAEGPELLRAFWQAIENVTVLDPTCGSGAFLFAALRILETLYSDCLDRMERFVEDFTAKPQHPKRFADFKQVLAQIADHPSQKYFILKSIIINNLFGVDIMDEAVEICKLRLFLKLAAQTEPNQKIEPLPDIDFNIRAGNTLVGYATLDEIRKGAENEKEKNAEGKSQGLLLLQGDAIQRIEEDAEMVARSFQQFRAQQTTHGGSITHEDKQELRSRLAKLNAELDRYLAGEYGVNVEKQKDFDAWKATHQPFHWFVEFYSIMSSGGFDVIIGNPPYVEYSKIRSEYQLLNYTTLNCGNLYAYVIERCFGIAQLSARVGMIVQLPIVCTDRMIPLQSLYSTNSSAIWFSTFDDRPGKLFDGLQHIRATIAINALGSGPSHTLTTKYNRWISEARDSLFENLRFCEMKGWHYEGAVPKIGTDIDTRIAQKIMRHAPLEISLGGSTPVYFHNAPQYWTRFMSSKPYFWNEREGAKLSTQVNTLLLPSKTDAAVTVAALNSTLFYWWFLLLSDCRHLNMREIERFPLGLDAMPTELKSSLASLTAKLMTDFKRHKNRKECRYKATGKVVYDEYYPKHSKPIIDEIDRLLAQHYGFTDEEVDFIINYDIKYRMGHTGGEEEA